MNRSLPLPGSSTRSLPASLLTLLTIANVSDLATSQCTSTWLTTGNLGLPGAVHATVVHDPDGPGPLGPQLAIGGQFANAGSIGNNNLVAWDLQANAWRTYGLGLNGTVRALASLPNGDLIAAGTFTAAGAVAANNIARWNGSSWSSLGGGLNGTVRAVVALPNGLIVGGDFSSAGGSAASFVARWNGVAWTGLGAGTNAPVHALTVRPSSGVIAGGSFTTAGGVAANAIAQWDGLAWSTLGAGMTNPGGPTATVNALVTTAAGDVIAGGSFAQAGGATAGAIARWDGASWSQLGQGFTQFPPFTSTVFALATTATGDLLIGGRLPALNMNVGRWNGATLTAVGVALTMTSTAVSAVAALPNGDIAAGGDVALPSLSPAVLGVARWSPAFGWAPLPAHFNGLLSAFTAAANGDPVVGGQFTWAGNGPANRIARLQAGVWTALGAGLNGAPQALATSPNGDVIAGGSFTLAGTTPANGIARWDGTAWLPMGTGVAGVGSVVRAIAALPDGSVIAAGQFTTAGGVSANNIARWDGTTWWPLGNGIGGSVAALAVLPGGDVIAGGLFAVAGGVPANGIARWNGTAWSPLGGGVNGAVSAIAVGSDGSVFVGGTFTLAGSVATNDVARWNGTSWSALGAGSIGDVRALVVFPDGDVLVGSGDGARRWNGTTWSTTGIILGPILAMARVAQGIGVGGNFHSVNGTPSSSFAVLTTPCLASATAFGSGCSGAAGLTALTPITLPWVGSTFVAQASGMMPNSLALEVLGTGTQPTPLSAISPLGIAGCMLLVSPDVVFARTTGTGTATLTITVPNTVALANLLVQQQIVPLEIDAGGAITALTSTNALALTIGSL